ncbi:Fic family protein [Vulgatibacter incomptus]|uniref:Fic family protein, putative n=1 Tax=Vulgatibacter incomptus TaxID=1391653 RepID=A0A0K1PAU2_9BACT|nr:Fic family protein [Vulgatibacter incomptus]AKU90645.1 Fic family protein, putative [Vulgatibacter incomptus]
MTARFVHLDSRNAELAERLSADPRTAEAYKRLYEMSWFHHEGGLEGEVLSEAELTQALEHLVVGDASLMAVISAIRRHRDALEHVRAHAAVRENRIDLPFLVEVFEILVRGDAGLRKRGLYRAEMPIHRTYTHEIALPERIEGELAKFVESLERVEFHELHPVRQAAQAHWQFMRVFPFVEHNGKIGRLVQAWYLLRAGYLPAIIHTVDRQRYFDSLRQPPSALRGLLLDALENSLENSAAFIDGLREQRSRRASNI